MSLELRVSGGALDGLRAGFGQDRVLIGRDPHADLRFDAERDREVSTRHAEIRRVEGRYLVRDLNSTNGTFLNGTRIADERPLRDGDRIGCGRGGPVLTVSLTGPGIATSSGPTMVAGAGGAPPAGRRLVLAGTLAAVTITIAAGGWLALGRLSGAGSPVPPGAASDSGAGAIVGLDRSATGADSALLPAATQSRGEGVAAPAATAPLPAARSSGEMDYTSVVAANGPAIVLVAVEMPGGERSTGTAFSVNRSGLLVTNRHVVRDADGALPQRIAVQFADTDAWLPARVVRVSETAELATLQVEREGPFPAVRGLAAPGTQPAVGSPVALIGYPLGLDTPMDRSDAGVIATASLFRGMVSKSVRGVMQIDAYAGHGSSGSPVFDRRGAVVGVVWGGPREGAGRIVYAVSGDELLAFVPESAARRLP